QPTRAQEVYDVSGAGDTVIAAMGLCLAAGYTLPEAMHTANAAASIVVAKLGTAVCSFNELVHELAT
ncbi:PfkB family carbohydrate kinase, partial [Kingella oralis]